jgi:hypothetical protein
MIKQVQEIKQKTVNYELLEEILNSIKDNVEDNKTLFQQYVNAAKAEGLDESEIWKLAKEILGAHVALRTLYRWAHEFLSEEAFMEVRQKANLSRHNIGLVATRQQIQEHIECESCAEAYSIEKIKSGSYSYEYLQQVCIWLHETLEINCKGKL